MKRFSLALLLALAIAVSAYAGSQTVSSTTASDIINNAEVYLNDTANDFWSAAELLVLLNDGALDIVSRTRCLEGSESINLTNGTIEYSVTGPYIAITAVLYDDGEADPKWLTRWLIRDFDNLTIRDVGEPKYWYEWSGKVGVFPPVDTVDNETITVYYVSRPTDVTSGQNVLVPAQYDKALTYYIVFNALMKHRSRQDEYQKYVELYLQELDRFRTDHSGLLQKESK